MAATGVEGPHPPSPLNVGGRWCELRMLVFHTGTEIEC